MTTSREPDYDLTVEHVFCRHYGDDPTGTTTRLSVQVGTARIRFVLEQKTGVVDKLWTVPRLKERLKCHLSLKAACRVIFH